MYDRSLPRQLPVLHQSSFSFVTTVFSFPSVPTHAGEPNCHGTSNVEVPSGARRPGYRLEDSGPRRKGEVWAKVFWTTTMKEYEGKKSDPVEHLQAYEYVLHHPLFEFCMFTFRSNVTINVVGGGHEFPSKGVFLLRMSVVKPKSVHSLLFELQNLLADMTYSI